MPRGDTNKKGMPPSRNTVFVRPDVSEQAFADNWARAFGSVDGNRQAKSKFEREKGAIRHIVKVRRDDGSTG